MSWVQGETLEKFCIAGRSVNSGFISGMLHCGSSIPSWNWAEPRELVRRLKGADLFGIRRYAIRSDRVKGEIGGTGNATIEALIGAGTT